MYLGRRREGGGERRSKERKWGLIGEAIPPLAVHFNSKSNMAGRINGSELVALCCPNKTPVSQTNHWTLYVYLYMLQPKKMIR